MVDEGTPEKPEKSVEQNLGNEYVPQSKVGNLPISNQIPDKIKKEMEKTQKDIDKFKKEITKKYKNIEALGIVPAQAAKKIEEEYEIPEEECKKKLIHLLMVIPESRFKEIGKIKLEAISLLKKINEKIWVHILTPIDIWNLCLDSKFEIVEAFGMCFPILDNGILGNLRVASIHKSLVLRKFEKYVTSYVISGSMVRGTATKTSDIDVFVVIDDTDVKRMSRLELKERIRSIIYSYIMEAEAMAGVKNKLNVQVYLLTDFWEAVKDASPVIFTFIRDGVPLYDRGAFLPWKSLLRMGKIKPSPEAIDMFMSSGERIGEMVKRKLLELVIGDIYWGVLTPSQALLMLYGLPPSTHKETPKQIREIFVVKEKLLEKKYADILEEIVIKFYKGYEHGKVKEVSGETVDRLLKDAEEYITRLKELREQIEQRIAEKDIQKTYEDLFGMVSSLVKKQGEKEILGEFEKSFVKESLFPRRFLENLEFVAKTRKDILEKPKKKAVKKKPVKKKSSKNSDDEDDDKVSEEKLSRKEFLKVDKSKKIAEEIINAITEFNQRCDFLASNKGKFLLKAKDRNAEVLFLKNVFVIQDRKIYKLGKDKLVDSTVKELETQIMENKTSRRKINPQDIESLKNIFGEFELGY